MSASPPSGGAEVPLPSDRPGPESRLVSGEIYYTDEELIKAQRSRLVELERQAREFEAQILDAQARLRVLAIAARDRSVELEKQHVAGLVPWAEEEAVAIVLDARHRAAELSPGPESPPELEDLGRMLLSHFELQEQVVHLLREAALGVGPGDRS
jgi:hypothetical protein